jgi:hypothetical protein
MAWMELAWMELARDLMEEAIGRLTNDSLFLLSSNTA